MPMVKMRSKRKNGYSNVSSAPDMENSIVAEPARTEGRARRSCGNVPGKMTSAELVKRRRGRPVKEKPVKEAADASPTVGAPKRRTAKAAEKKTAKAAENTAANTAAEAAETKTEKAAENKQAKPERTRKTAVKAAKNEKNGFERVELAENALLKPL
ncbi:MAG: hypothetical protein ACLS4Z_03410 [Christensenellaceae bacterium]